MITKINRFWWQTIPLAMARVSRVTGAIAADGIYLVSFQKIAAFTPLLVFILGCVSGWLGLGAEAVFSESLILILLALAAGAISTLHGALFVAGFALVDFFVNDHAFLGYNNPGAQVKLRVALIITYVAMAVLAVGVPFLVRAFRSSVPLSVIRMADARLIAEIVASSALYGGLTFLYLQALPLLIRPPFTWLESTPTVAAAYQAQNFTLLIVGVAAVLGGARIITEAVAAAYDFITPDIFMKPVEESLNKGGVFDNLPQVATVLTTAAVLTFFFSGLTVTWLDTALLFGGLVGIGFARQLLAKILPAWPKTMDRIPVLLRLAIGLGIVYGLSSPYMNFFYGGQSFASLLWAALLGGLILALFFPPIKREPKKEEKPNEDEEIL